MRKQMLSIFFVTLCASSALAQSSGGYHKIEFYGGYTIEKAQTNIKAVTVDGATLDSCASGGEGIFGINFQNFFCERQGFDSFDNVVADNLIIGFGTIIP